MPKIFKWYKDDFGFSKQEILAYYASFMEPHIRSELTDVARNNNFIIKHDKYEWNLNLIRACSEATRQPRQLITNAPASSPSRQPPQQQQQQQQRMQPPPQQGSHRNSPQMAAPQQGYRPQPGYPQPVQGGSYGVPVQPPQQMRAANQPIVGLQLEESGMDGFMC